MRSVRVIVLHGWWSPSAGTAAPGRLVLWAEDGLGPAEVPRRPGRRPRLRSHPFALPGDQVAKALGLDVSGELTTGTAELSLPSYPNAPAASPELLDLQPRPATGTLSGPRPDVRWRVPTAVVAPVLAAPLLRRLRAVDEAPVTVPDDGGLPDRAVVVGADVRCLIRLAGFAADLAGRGRVLPVALAASPTRAVARWRPLVTGADAGWLRAAVAALPPASVAGSDGRGTPGAAVAGAVDDLVDVVVRERIATTIRRGAGRKGQGRGGARTVDAAWRAALTGPDPEFDATADQARALGEAIAAWQADALGGGAVRACFRLMEPADGGPDDEWRLEFALQVADEPSLVVPAAQIWERGRRLRSLTRHVAQPQEALLGELGRALRLYPALAAPLAGAKPAELVLDTAGAHEFLAQVAPLLLGAGFGVLLPGWWTRPSARIGARLRATTPGQPGRVEGTPAFGQEHLVEFDWRLSVGDDVLTDDEVEALIEAQTPLVRVRGAWLQVDADRLRRARDFLRRNAERPDMTVGQVLRVLGSPDDGPGGLPVTGVDAEGWLGDLLAASPDRRLAEVPVPPGFTGVLRPYQERGLAWLSFLEAAGLGGVLADDMGLGKTVQLLALIGGDTERGATAPTLLVCPMSLVGNWQREAARFLPGLRVHVHHGRERPRGREFTTAVAAADLVVTTYALLARDAAALGELPWHRVILDEAQAVKNAATRAASAARSMPAPHRVAVTGTPVENRLADLWSLMEFANPGLLGAAADFKRRFAVPIERLGDEDAGARLRSLTQPFVLRRLKTDATIIRDLPPKLEMDVVCTLTTEQAALYQSVVADMLARIEETSGIERRGLVLATMTKLKQVCNHPAQFLRDGSRLAGRSGKLARLEETLEEILAAGEKALLFTQFAEFGEMLRTHLVARFGREVAFLHGGLGKAQRDDLVARFQSGDLRSPPIFVLSLKAGGTGLTLTAANHVFHVDRWWNPAVEDQATDRAFRIGQTRAVQVRKFVCAGTLEERIAGMISDKRGLAASVVGTGEGWLTELSTSQLRDLLTLDASAVVS
jgi:hypothetical protein